MSLKNQVKELRNKVIVETYLKCNKKVVIGVLLSKKVYKKQETTSKPKKTGLKGLQKIEIVEKIAKKLNVSVSKIETLTKSNKQDLVNLYNSIKQD
jgi:hypothetical protein